MDKNDIFFKENSLTDIEKKHGYQEGKGVGRSYLVHIHTPNYEIIQKDPLYSMWNPSQHSAINYMGKAHKRNTQMSIHK